MIRLQPIEIPQTFSIIPSSYDLSLLNAATVTLVENGVTANNLDGYNSVWSLLDEDWDITEKYFVIPEATFVFSLSQNGNYIEVTFQTPIDLEEGDIYTFTVQNDDDIFYKDLIYIGENQFDYVWSTLSEDWDVTEKEFIDVETSKKDVFTLPDNYNEYNPGKTEYIVL